MSQAGEVHIRKALVEFELPSEPKTSLVSTIFFVFLVNSLHPFRNTLFVRINGI